jgi:hypothetical protein
MDFYKVNCLNNNGKIEKIIVFSGTNKPLNTDIFSNIELQYIQDENIEVAYSNQEIHSDDSIYTVKIKILKEFDNKYAYEELCLFGKIKHYINASQVFSSVTENERIGFNKEYMSQLVINLNMDETEINKIEKKNNYYYEDLIALENKEYELLLSLGRKFAKQRNYLYSANPFSIISQKSIVTPNKQNELISFENTLLLNYGKMLDNNIYLCFAEDVYEYASQNSLDELYISEMYFPLLYNKDITNKSQLLKEKYNLIDKNKKTDYKLLYQLYDTVTMFYDIYHQRKTDLVYEEKGINKFEIIINTELNANIPLEIIFKNIHASKIIPFIKFNPGSLRENIYRIYSEMISKNGKKIPYLNENMINQLSRKLGKGRQISLYIENEYKFANITKKINIYINIENNGSIRVYGELKKPVLKEELNVIIENSVNPVIKSMNDFLQQSGYSISLFKNFEDEIVEVVKMTYRSKMKIQKDINLKKYENCLSSIFHTIDSDISAGAHLLFKRVDNYQLMDEKRILIKRIYDETNNLTAIINELIRTYNMNENEAQSLVVEYFNETTDIRGKIIENPGFNTFIKTEPLENNLIIEIDNITSIDYLQILNVYIDSILRITQSPDSTNVPSDKINSLCVKSKLSTKNIEKGDINNVITTNIDANFIPNVKKIQPISLEGPVVDDDDEVDDDALFYEDDDDAIVEEEIEEIEEVEESVEPEKVEPEKVEPEKVEPEKVEPEKVESQQKESVESDETSAMFYEDSSSAENSKSNSDKVGGMIEENESPDFRMKIDGTKLSNPNIFEERIKKRDPKLFFTKDGNYSSYSRSCESNVRRQPVILTQQEKDDIDKNHKGSYNHAIKYGTDPNNQHWYICPRYWCLLTNSSITEEEVKSGKCGKIIPRGSTTVPPGHYVYEFNHPEEHQRKDGTYIDHYPGFLDKKKHADGYCLPCCFTKWDSEYMRKRRQVCSQDETPAENITEKNVAQKPANYVMGIDKYPLDKNRWGFLPFSVQSFLQTNNAECISKNNPALIRPDASCLLRYGIEKNKTQSFIGCIADIYASIQSLNEVPSIKEMKDILIASISLDDFLQYHNASLVSVFKPKNMIDDVDIDKYNSTQFMKTINVNNPVEFDFLENTIASYENFIAFLKSEDSLIDHTYLWDCITQPNSKFLKDGVNLVILEITNKDITDNMEILCPTNSQSSLLYDSRKKTLILLKHDSYYEPIYLYNEDSNKIVKTFDEHNSPKNIKKILNIIQKTTQKYCSSLPSLPNVYEFKKNIPVKELITILKNDKYYVESQVLNYQGKVIGILVKQNTESNSHVFIPCLPSSVVSNIQRKYMEDPAIWNDYQTTKKELFNIHAASKGKIPCKPMMKIIEDGLIVGILTETNQFVQINKPIENVENDGLIPINNMNYTVIDNIIMNTNKVDTERTETVKKIRLESQFYDVFRSIVRNSLNDYINRGIRRNVLELIDNKTLIYKEKLRTTIQILENLIKYKVMFSEIDEKILMDLNNISACSVDCNESSGKTYCLVNDNGECQFIIPKNNLVSGQDNMKIYFARVSDELLRYKRVQLFMLNPKSYLNIGNNEYKINSDEFLLLQSLLTPEYFKDIEPFNTNKFIQNVDYNNSNPAISQKYSNEPILLREQEETLEKSAENQLGNECINVIRDVIGNPTTSLWKRNFQNKKFSEIVFNNTPNCSYQVIIHILEDKLKKLITVENLKVTLWNAYSKYYEKYSNKILTILKKQGKTKLLENVVKNKISFEDIIASDSYYLTDLDIWMLADKLKLPIILFSSTKLGNLVDSIDWLLLGGDLSKPFYFIRSPQNMKPTSMTGYNLITPAVELSEVNEFYLLLQDKLLKNKDSPQENLVTLTDYLEKYIYIKK